MNAIQTIVEERYRIGRVRVSPQKGGWAARAYKLAGDSNAFFLKVYDKSRASTPKWTALIDTYVPITVWLLQNSGLNGKLRYRS